MSKAGWVPTPISVRALGPMGKSKVKWFLKGQADAKRCQYKKSRWNFFLLENGIWRAFNLKYDNDKLCVDVITVNTCEHKHANVLINRS